MTDNLSQEEAAERLRVVTRLKEDFKYYSAGCLKLVDKNAVTRPFVMNKAQQRIEDAIQEQETAGLPVRILIVKARQLGASTYVTGRFLWKAATQTNQSIMEVAHDVESAQGLLSKVRFYYENLPSVIQPLTKYRTKQELFFEDLNSSFKVATANNESLGRSRTLTMVHLSEVGFYGKEGEKALLSVTQAVPDKPGTAIIGESTSNGMDSIWYDLVDGSLRGENAYKVVFLGWFLDPDYCLPDKSPMELSHEEADLKKEHKLSYGQLRWRRHAIDNLCQGSIDKFRQEYPSNCKESFMYSGHPCFSLAELTLMRERVKAPIFRGDVDTVGKCLTENKEGDLKIYEYGNKNTTYCMGLDVAEGIEDGDLDRDYSVLQILNAVTLKQVAVLRTRVSTDLLPYVVFFLGKMYNYAYLCPEINNHGLAVVQKLKDLRYNRIYKRRNLEQNHPDRTSLLGFKTTKNTKPVIIDGLAELIRTGETELNDVTTLNELSKFSKDPRGKMGATTGHDDTVIALALSCFMLRYAPVQREVMTQHKKKQPLNFRQTFDEMANQPANEQEAWVKETFASELERKGIS